MTSRDVRMTSRRRVTKGVVLLREICTETWLPGLGHNFPSLMCLTVKASVRNMAYDMMQLWLDKGSGSVHILFPDGDLVWKVTTKSSYCINTTPKLVLPPPLPPSSATAWLTLFLPPPPLFVGVDLKLHMPPHPPPPRRRCRVSGVPPGRECSEDFGGLAIMAVRSTRTGSRGKNLRVVGIHSDG